MTDIGVSIGNAFASAVDLLVLTIPRIIGFLLILLIGWIISGLLASLITTVLRTIKFNNVAQRAGITGFIQKMGLNTDPASVVANIVKWFIRLIALVAAFDALGLPAVSQIVQQFLLWIPNLIVAIVILVIAGLIANLLSDLVRGASAQAGLGNPDMLATITRAAVWGFGIIAAVNQIGVASTLVNTLFTGLIAALALALGLAFGLGGRDTAAQIVQGWYKAGQEAQPKLERAAQAAKREVTQAPDTAPQPTLASPEPYNTPKSQ
jgi:flagellar biosynthesis protein FliQ